LSQLPHFRLGLILILAFTSSCLPAAEKESLAQPPKGLIKENPKDSSHPLREDREASNGGSETKAPQKSILEDLSSYASEEEFKRHPIPSPVGEDGAIGSPHTR